MTNYLRSDAAFSRSLEIHTHNRKKFERGNRPSTSARQVCLCRRCVALPLVAKSSRSLSSGSYFFRAIAREIGRSCGFRKSKMLNQLSSESNGSRNATQTAEMALNSPFATTEQSELVRYRSSRPLCLFRILGDDEGERHHALLATVVSNFSLSQTDLLG